jgi:hypothetical protein
VARHRVRAEEDHHRRDLDAIVEGEHTPRDGAGAEENASACTGRCALRFHFRARTSIDRLALAGRRT